MLNFFRTIGEKSLKNTLVIFNAFLIIVIISLITFINHNYYKSKFSEKELEHITQSQYIVQRFFDNKLKSVEQSILVLLREKRIISAFQEGQNKEQDTEKKRLKAENELRAIMAEYNSIYPEYLNIVLTDIAGERYYSNDSYRIDEASFRGEAWLEDALTQPLKFNYYFHSATRNIASWKQYGENSYISISKAIIDPLTEKAMAVVLIDVDLEAITYNDNTWTDMTEDAAFMFFMNELGQVVLSPSNGLAYRVKATWFQSEPSGSLQANLNGKNYNLFFQRSKQFPLTLVSIYAGDFLEKTSQHILITNWLIALLAIILASLWSLYYISAITKPLYSLSSLMKKSYMTGFKTHFTETCDGEIEKLRQSFNQMIDKIQHLMKENELKESERRAAEIRILQEQLKPHFLYNTLDTIICMVRQGEYSAVIQFTKSLSLFYRLALSKGEEYITLENELNIIKNYLDVQMVRYEGLFSYEINCPDHLREFLVMRMILQPLVENSIYHGFKETEPAEALISINVVEHKDKLLISVSDNGPGLSKQKIIELNECFRTQTIGELESYGLKNVSQRLKLSKNKEAYIRIAEDEAVGFTVTVVLSKEDKLYEDILLFKSKEEKEL